MKNLVIVESPAKCKTIQKYLGKDYIVMASYGHIRDLPSKDGSVAPEEDFAMHYEVSSDSTRHVKALADAAKGAESVILATDPDREGEAISWHVVEELRRRRAIKKSTPIKRVSFNSITKKAVNEALQAPRELDMDLVNAQQARRALDYLVGFNLSPVLWRKLPGSRSAGRVQSVALRLICSREEEIERFRPEDFWTIEGIFKGASDVDFTARLTHYSGDKLEKFTIKSRAEAGKIAQETAEAQYSVEKIEKKEVKRNPQAPFTTSTLQQEAARKLGFSAKRTMQIAQKLYEGVALDGGETTGLITYMRTDAVTVVPEAVMATRDMIRREYGDDYLPGSPRMFKSKAQNAQEAHEAIRPTDPTRSPDAMARFLDVDQLKLYDLIWKRLVASQMAQAVFDQSTVHIDAHKGKCLQN